MIRQGAAIAGLDLIKKDSDIERVFKRDILDTHHHARANDLFGMQPALFLDRKHERDLELGHWLQILADPAIDPGTADVLGLGNKVGTRSADLNRDTMFNTRMPPFFNTILLAHSSPPLYA